MGMCAPHPNTTCPPTLIAKWSFRAPSWERAGTGVHVIGLLDGSRIQPSEKVDWKAASVPPWMRTRPSSRSTTAKEERGEGRDDSSMEAWGHTKLDCVVSSTQQILRGTS